MTQTPQIRAIPTIASAQSTGGRRASRPLLRSAAALGAALALSGCEGGLDLDLRGNFGSAMSTAEAAKTATAERPRPDDRGIISYPNYQVAVAKRGDTLATVAARIGADANALATFNGVQTGDSLREGEIIALPNRVAEPSPLTGASGTGPIRPAVDITTLAGGAIDRAGAQQVETTALPSTTAAADPKAQTGLEPTRHKVQRGETAFTIARLYDVSVRSLSEWNGLDEKFTIREGQYLLIPVAEQRPPQSEKIAKPGFGNPSPTPTPPSAVKPLPDEKTVPVAQSAAQAAKVAPDLGKTQSKATTSARLAYPVSGKIIREYTKGKSDGIDLSAAAGSPIKAADAGTVAAITSDADQVPIIVIKHSDGLLTVYANAGNIAVKKGDSVSRGQKIASLRADPANYVHFEVRKGFESVDPLPYLQ